MTLNKLIENLQKLQAEGHGDLEVFDAKDYLLGESDVKVTEGGDNFPDDWEMPEKFLRIGNSFN